MFESIVIDKTPGKLVKNSFQSLPLNSKNKEQRDAIPVKIGDHIVIGDNNHQLLVSKEQWYKHFDPAISIINPNRN